MSRENVEIVRRVYRAAAKGDSEAVFALYDAGVELDASRLQLVWVAPGRSGVYRGHEGLRAFFREWHEGWENIEYDFDELIDAGGDHVVSVVTRRARGRASGAEVELHTALLWTIRDGKVILLTWYTSRAEALDAAAAEQ